MFKTVFDDFKNLFVTVEQLDDFAYLSSLKTCDYPRILKKICYEKIREKLNFSNPKTFIDKINWLKFYDDNSLRRILTDKIFVRDWVSEQIGDEYLIECYQVCDNFDEIDFDKLPNSFVIKTNHAKDWQKSIKNKEKMVEVKPVFNLIKQTFDNWQKSSYVIFSCFDMRYMQILSKLIIEEKKNFQDSCEFGVYCFNGEPKISELFDNEYTKVCIYDENFNESKYTFTPKVKKEFIQSTDVMKKAFELSKKLSKDFKFVRVDWKIIDGKLYFEEMNFTPYSGLIVFEDENWNKELGELIKL